MRRVKDDQTKWVYDLYQIGQTIHNAKSTTVLQELLEHITQGFAADSGSIALLNDEGVLVLVAASGAAEEYVGNTIPTGEGVLGWVVNHKTPLLLSGDITNDERFVFTDLQRRTESRPLSSMCWPLMTDMQVIGAISINRGPFQEVFTYDDFKDGEAIVGFASLAVDNVRLHDAYQARIYSLHEMNKQLAEQRDNKEALLKELQQTQERLLQSEKMASIGQLAAGVAHEINNPVGYINSNLKTLQQYMDTLLKILALYENVEEALSEGENPSLEGIAEYKSQVDADFIKDDIVNLVKESLEGSERIRKIVQDLKDFSHIDETEWHWANIHQGLDSTLNIVNNEIKYKVDVIKEYGDIPEIECIASQLNQVFMNILVNAGHAIDKNGTIKIRTGAEKESIYIEISDTGKGMSQEVKNRIFEPFYTTKPVGQGTGLGLSLAYGIVKKHQGNIEVDSKVGVGTTFRINLPINRDESQNINVGAL